jgi:endonuclease YncB( thermonuclease family)
MGRCRGDLLAAVLAAKLIVMCGCSGAIAQEQGNGVSACGGGVVARGIAKHAIDGRTFLLDDGREVRLAAIEVPPLEGAAALGTAAKAALEALVGGDEVVLRQAGSATDRYGRLVAYAAAVRDGDELFAQGELLAAGFARVSRHVDSWPCVLELRKSESAARQARLGLWADSDYGVLDAEATADVLARQGRFALVEGKVVSVRESGATIYVNFGRRWSEEFAVTVLKRNERNFAAAGLDLKGLAGRRIRVRGFVEARGGTGQSPRIESAYIEAAYPEQIETADVR